MRALLLSVLLVLSPALADAAVSCALLTQGESLVNDTGSPGYATASVSPGANRLVLAILHWQRNATDLASIDPFTATGNGLTYEQVARVNYSTAGAPSGVLVMFRSMGASPSAGAITFTWEVGFTSGNAGWIVVECTGVDTSGSNGSGAIVQSDTDSCAPCTELSGLALAAFGHANNATLSAFGIQNDAAITPEGGSWSELAEEQVTEAGMDNTVSVSFLASNDTSPTSTWASIDAAGLAIEIKAAAATRRAVAPMVFQ